MQKYKIILRDTSAKEQAEVSSSLSLSKDYLVNTVIEFSGNLTNKDNVRTFLDDTKNQNLATEFLDYLKNNTTNQEFEQILYNNEKLSNTLNDYYALKTIRNKEPNKIIISEKLVDTTKVNYTENYFVGNNRKNKTKTKIEQMSKKDSFYITVLLTEDSRPISLTTTNKYTRDCVENGILYKQCFVNLNQNDNAFDGLSF